jgi:hypothetical protein
LKKEKIYPYRHMITRGFFEEKKILAAYPIASKDFFLKEHHVAAKAPKTGAIQAGCRPVS